MDANNGLGPLFEPDPVADAAAWAERTLGGYSALQDAGRQSYLAERRQRSEGERAFNVWMRLSPIGRAAFREHLDKYHRSLDPNVPDIVDAEIIDD